MRTPDARPRVTLLRRTLAGVAAVTAAAMIGGCGLENANGYIAPAEPAAIEQHDSLEGVEITVGSKDFTEQLILGNMYATVLQTAGATVTNRSNIAGSVGVRNALLNGSVDVSPEYTGTGWISYLGHDKPVKGEQEQWQAVHDEDLGNGLTWLPFSPVNNTYAFAMGPDASKKLGITSLSEIKDLPVAERTFCVEDEFFSREDGFQPMLATYGLEYGKDVPAGNVLRMDTGVVYDATARGECNFGEVFTTDGRILALDLAVLEDDKGFFPLYNLAPVIQTDLVEQHPEIAEVFAQLQPLLTNEVLLELNAQVDVDGGEPALVARDWLREQGLVE
ncbi:glycine betaine ABC transporter substrate-binding protein [Mumia zhuanghuii]|uniref:Glycine betaine ABC transporter substrate-binding protein n=2 Tax=Mumia TaxID=1546255 RepID=A0ABW1QKK4_9ACTN|nr:MULTISPECIES: glycine betaine ABC transporter substrate-binding protein [Mumia]KAA1423260.1 glycine betaine ABC transporter substrate-binding protein [Mumia zhuanghuii]